MTIDDTQTVLINDANDPVIDAQSLFDEFRPGYTLSIRRLRPTWCSGFLERLECFEGDKIDIDYIIQQWGGKRLSIRMLDEHGRYKKGVELNLSSYPCKFQGRIMDPNDGWRSQAQESTAMVPAAPNIADPLKLIEVLQVQRKNDLAQMQKMFGNIQAPTVQAVDPLKQLAELGKTYKQLKGIFGNEPVSAPSAPQPEEPENPGFGLNEITQLVQLLKPAAPQPSATPRIVADRPVAPQPVPVPSPVNLAGELAKKSEQEYTNILLTSLQAMPEDKRETIIAGFLQLAGIDDNEDEFENEIEPETTPEGTPRPENT